MDVAIINTFSITAVVCRDDLGDVIFSHTSFMPLSGPLIGEVNVTLLALKLDAHYNLTFIPFERDLKFVIDNLQSSPPIISDLLLDAILIVSSSSLLLDAILILN